MTEKFIEMAVEIVSSQASNKSMSTEEIQDSLRETYGTLLELLQSPKAKAAGEEEAPKGIMKAEAEPEEKSQMEVAPISPPASPAVVVQSEGELADKPEAEPEREEAAETAMGPGTTGLEKLRATPEESIQEDKVICLECGAEFRQLAKRHLELHGMTADEYKKKWGFPRKQALSAKSLTRARSEAAKERGLPENLEKYLNRRSEQKKEREREEREKAKESAEMSAT
jgi:predicted transcriptional regulator